MPTDLNTNGADVLLRLRRMTMATLFACIFLPATAQSFEVMTLNIRLDLASDGPNAWDERKADMAFFVSSRHPDFFCLQEGLIQQLRYLDGQLPAYRRIGVGRDDGADKGEFSAVYYDTTRFALVRSTTFWLSDTPDTVSVGWDAALPRVCTYGLFRDRTSGKLVHLFNTHFDHMGVVAREKSAILILDRIAEWTTDDERVLLTGDLNSAPKDRPVAILRDRLIDGADIAPYGLVGPTGTWNGFDPTVTPDHRIDYIFVRNLEVVTYRHLDDRRKNGLWISDHLPVRATLKM